MIQCGKKMVAPTFELSSDSEPVVLVNRFVIRILVSGASHFAILGTFAHLPFPI